jgi:tight adherence protein B
MPPVLYILTFLAAFLAVEGLAMLASERWEGARATARRRLRRIALGIQSPDQPAEGTILRARREAGRALVDFARWVPGAVQLERRLYQAGVVTPPGRFVLLCVALGVAGWLVGSMLLDSTTLAAPFCVIGVLPFVRIGQLRAKRITKFEEQFPDALDLMTRAMRAGHSLSFGFQMVGDELADPIGTEFAQVAEEIKLGQDTRVALRNLTYRMEAGDLPFFVTAITIQRETGGNLAEVLEKLGYLIRDRFALYGKVRALTAVGRASANLLASMPLVMVGALYTCGGEGGRSYVKPLLTTVPGMYMAAIAGALVLIGFVFSRRFARIEV